MKTLNRVMVLLGICSMGLALAGCQEFIGSGEPPVTWVPLPTVVSTSVADTTQGSTPVLVVEEAAATATATREPATAAPAPPTATAPPPTAARVEMIQGWQGTLHTLPAGGSGAGIAFRVLDEPGKESGIAASSVALQAQLEELADGPYVVRIWGVLRKSAAEHGGSLIIVDRMEAAAAEPTPAAEPTAPPTATAVPPSAPPAQPTAQPAATAIPAQPAGPPTLVMATATELVEGWVGTVHSLPPGTSYTAYFRRTDASREYGISSLVPRIQQELAAYRDTGETIRIWGVVDFGVVDHQGRRIVVTRIERATP